MNEEYIDIIASKNNAISSAVKSRLKKTDFYYENELSNKEVSLYSDLLSDYLIKKYKDGYSISFMTKNKGYELGIIAKLLKKEREKLHEIKKKLFIKIKININEKNKNVENEIEVFEYFGEEMPKYDFTEIDGVYILTTESVSQNCQDLVEYFTDYIRSNPEKDVKEFIDNELIQNEDFVRSLIRIMIKSVVFGITDIRSDNLVIDKDSKKLYLVDFICDDLSNVSDDLSDISIINLADNVQQYEKTTIIGRRNSLNGDKKVKEILFDSKDKSKEFNFFIDFFIASQIKDIKERDKNRIYNLESPDDQSTTTLLTESSQLLLNILKQIYSKENEEIFKSEFKKIYEELKNKETPDKYIKNMEKLNCIIKKNTGICLLETIAYGRS